MQLLNYGKIYGGATAVLAEEGVSNVTNDGKIAGNYGVVIRAGQITNNGTILGGASVGYGGVIQNNTDALISGRLGAGGGTVTNFGSIIGSDLGVNVSGVGQILNGSATDRTVLIQGTRGAELDEGGTVVNFGAIRGTSHFGLRIKAGTVTNGAAGDTGASITGASGLESFGAVTMTNYGAIQGWAGDGVSLTGGGMIFNGTTAEDTAQISGYSGVAATGMAASVVNYGSILASGAMGHPAIDLAAGGGVVNGSGGADPSALIRGVTGVDLGATGDGAEFRHSRRPHRIWRGAARRRSARQRRAGQHRRPDRGRHRRRT
jgi:adhesin HecA-like repeat protein